MYFNISQFGISESDAASIVSGVALGEYSLLLGAGFSLGARNGSNRPIPTSGELAKELNENFKLGLRIDGAASLPVAYEDAIFKSGEDSVSSFLRNRLTNCVPSWHGVLAKMEWDRVWTLNIDDVLRSVFSEKSVFEYSFRDEYRVRQKNALQIIYLHGRADRSGPKIFSIQEYHDSIRGEGHWHTGFFTEYKERPFIVCGASLIGEVDLARTLRAKNQSELTRGVPSVAVIKGLDESSSARLKDRLGLLPVNASGEDFFVALLADVSKFISLNPHLLPSAVNPNHARRFGQDFQILQPDKPGRSPPRQDFYAGDEPLWSDIVAQKDALLTFSRAAVDEILGRVSAGPVVVGIFGDAGSGKSTTMLRLARELSPLPTYLFHGDEDVDVDAYLECVSRTPSVLLFDDAADLSVGISALAAKARERNAKVAIVFAERSKRRKGVVGAFSSGDDVRYIDHSKLTPGDASKVIAKRRQARRLGSFASSTDAELRKLLINKHHGSLLSALSEIDIGNGFEHRLKELISSIEMDGGVGRLVRAVSQTHRWGYPLPLHFAAAVSGVSSDTIARNCSEDGRLSDLLFIERRGVRFRHRVLAEKVFDRTRNYDLMAEIARDLVVAISPIVNIEAIRSRSYAFRICKVLMERRSVYATLGGNVDKARAWYDSVEPHFGWNSRFWEQRALLELEAHSYSAAYSFARVAVDKERHAFPLTTFGTVCMIIAGHKSQESVAEAFEIYREGEAALQNALSIGRSHPETLLHPVSTFFSYAERLWPALQAQPHMRERVVSDWSAWLENAASVNYFRYEPSREAEWRGWLLRTAIRR